MKKKWQGFCRFVDSLHPVRMVALGYLTYILAGWVLLALPLSHAGARVASLDALFTSASALSTTGLATVSTGHGFSLFGQIVILALIQIGGIGYLSPAAPEINIFFEGFGRLFGHPELKRPS